MIRTYLMPLFTSAVGNAVVSFQAIAKGTIRSVRWNLVLDQDADSGALMVLGLNAPTYALAIAAPQCVANNFIGSAALRTGLTTSGASNPMANFTQDVNVPLLVGSTVTLSGVAVNGGETISGQVVLLVEE